MKALLSTADRPTDGILSTRHPSSFLSVCWETAVRCVAEAKEGHSFCETTTAKTKQANAVDDHIHSDLYFKATTTAASNRAALAAPLMLVTVIAFIFIVCPIPIPFMYL